MCSRLMYETGTGAYIAARGMDWSDRSAQASLWIFPRGMEREGAAGEGSLVWKAKYGSAIVTMYDISTADGINEAGLSGATLFLGEANFGDPVARGKPKLCESVWLQYLLDSFGSVAEVVKAMETDPVTIVPAMAPNGRFALLHVALSDASGDALVLEYIDGKLRMYHGREYRVMTNSPPYDQQLAIDAYWNLIGGDKFLPGTSSPADRFVRLSYGLQVTKKFSDPREAVAAAFSQIRAVGVPYGESDPNKPNISSTLWRTVTDHGAKRYYFESVLSPSVVWVDLDKLEFGPNAQPKTFGLTTQLDVAGSLVDQLTPGEPFKFLVAP